VPETGSGPAERGSGHRLDRAAPFERWQRVAEWPLTGAAILFLAAYSWQILAEPHGEGFRISEWTIWFTWAMFVADYLVSLVLAPRRWRWFYTHLIDLAIVVLPTLRPLRLMRFLSIIAIIQRGASTVMRGRVLLFTIFATLIVVYSASLAVYDAERDTGNITTFWDAVWWSFETITTVGYGDFYPVTLSGRIVAVGLMLGGIALLGVVTATLASWIVDRVSADEKKKDSVTAEHVKLLTREVQQLRQLLDERTRER